MINCAYCDCQCSPTREHVVPNWYSNERGSNYEIFNSRSPTRHTQGDIVVRDVCSTCNNTHLGKLDAYGKELYHKFFSTAVYRGESVEFECDWQRLLRWLLKLSFNSGRVHNADVSILRQYRNFILGQDIPSWDGISWYVHLVAPTDFGREPPQAAYRIIGSNEINAPTWFRITQFRADADFVSDVVQRQIYIDSYCFTLFVTSREDQEHTKELQAIQTKTLNLYPYLRRVPDTGSLILTAGDTHVYESITGHLDSYPTRYTGSTPSESSELGSIISELVHGNYKLLALEVTREEIEARNIALTCSSLWDLVRTRETAMSAMQRVAFFIDGYDDDPRELWDIPEAREWIVQVFRTCPFLFFLLMPAMNTLDVVALCFCKSDSASGTIIETDPDKMEEFFKIGFGGLNAVTQRFAISVEINKAITDSVFEMVQKRHDLGVTMVGDKPLE